MARLTRVVYSSETDRHMKALFARPGQRCESALPFSILNDLCTKGPGEFRFATSGCVQKGAFVDGHWTMETFTSSV